jgi:hypothetical protein
MNERRKLSDISKKNVFLIQKPLMVGTKRTDNFIIESQLSAITGSCTASVVPTPYTDKHQNNQ